MQFCFQKNRSDTWDSIGLWSASSGSSELEKFSLGFNFLFSVLTWRYQNHRGVCWSATWALQRTKTTPSTLCLPDLAWCKELFYVSTISSQHNGKLKFRYCSWKSAAFTTRILILLRVEFLNDLVFLVTFLKESMITTSCSTLYNSTMWAEFLTKKQLTSEFFKNLPRNVSIIMIGILLSFLILIQNFFS